MRLNTQLALLTVFPIMINCAFGQEIHYNFERGF